MKKIFFLLMFVFSFTGCMSTYRYDFSETELLQFDYIIIPEILHWEDRATAWSGLPDKVEIFIEIYDSRGVLVKEGSFYGESAKATLMSNDPSDLLAKPIRNFFKTVFESEL